MRTVEHVASSNIDAFAYSIRDCLLYVRFKSGKTYKYSSIAQATLAAFVDAPSKGQYLNAHIKRQHACELLPDEEASKIFRRRLGERREEWLVLALDLLKPDVDVSL